MTPSCSEINSPRFSVRCVISPLSPGVNLPPGSLLPRINGSRPRVSEYIYDGISVLQPEPGQVAFYPIIDVIEEFRVDTNSYGAEYGRSNGGVIMVNQKSGSNSFHGTAFECIQRPNRLTNPALPADQRNTGRWFNTAAFSQAP